MKEIYLNPILYTLLHGLLITGIAVKPSPYRWMFFPPIAIIGAYLYFTDNAELSAGVVIRASDFILLTDVQRELYQKQQQQHRSRHDRTNISDASFWARLKWSIQLLIGMRGIGWAHEPTTALPPRPARGTTRTRFLLSRLLWLLFFIVLFDVGEIAITLNPSFKRTTTAVPFAEQGMVWRSWSVLQFAVTSVPVLSVLLNVLPSMVCVGVGLSEPEEWPLLFGSFLDAYTLRGFWGRTWHQLLRRMFSSHGKYIAHTVLRLKHGSTVSTCVQLFVAFFLSSIVHTRSPYDSGAFRFFLSQAVAIMVEGAVIAVGKRMGLGGGKIVSCLGYVWVWCWLVYSVAPLWDLMLHTGMFDQRKWFSIVLGLSQGVWFPG